MDFASWRYGDMGLWVERHDLGVFLVFGYGRWMLRSLDIYVGVEMGVDFEVDII